MHELIGEIPEQLNAATVFVDANITKGDGDRVALYAGERTYTYRDVQELTNRTGNFLRDLGVEREQRVILLLLDSIEFIASLFGAIKIGAVPIPLNTFMRAADYEYCLNDSRASVLLVDEAVLPELSKISGPLKYLRRRVVVGKGQGADLSYHELADKASPQLEAAETHRDEPALWLYSSGSTGIPKGAVHLQRDMFVASRCVPKAILELQPDDIIFSIPKLFFAFGLGNSSYFPFSVGASTVLMPDRPTPEKVFQTIDRFKPTIFLSPPTLCWAMLQFEDAARYDLSSLRLVITGGEPLPPELYRQWKERFGQELYDVIGSTENMHLFIASWPGNMKLGASGKVVPGYEARIVDEDGNEAPVGEVGNLLIKGDSAAPFYWNKRELSRRTMLGEWLHTGDKFSVDEDGFYTYHGRTDDMLKVGGIWVSPIEVENALMEHAAVHECAVVGAADEGGLIKPKAIIVLNEGYTAQVAIEDELKTFVKENLAPFKYPRWVEFVDDLPKTATGKIQRFRFRQ